MIPISVALTLSALASMVSAHAAMFGVSVNGKDQGDGKDKYIRFPTPFAENCTKDEPGVPGKCFNDPVRDFKSPAIVCNTNGGNAVPSFVTAKAGDTLSFRWHLFDPKNLNEEVLNPNHKGAILTYIAPFTKSNGVGPIWSKFAQDGFDGEWATTKMIANGGEVKVSLPKSLAAGQYLIRQELLALHQADFRCDDPNNPGRGAESYPSCIQIEVTGSGDAVPDQNFDFNKGYTCGTPGLFFNIYVPFDKYIFPGPPVWKAD